MESYIALGVSGMALVALLALILTVRSSTSRGDGLSDRLIESIQTASAKTLEAETAKLETAQVKLALASETTRANALEEYISHDAKETSLDAQLAPDDVAGRVLRLSQRWSSVPTTTAASGGDGHGADGVKAVHVDTTATATSAHVVPTGSATVRAG